MDERSEKKEEHMLNSHTHKITTRRKTTKGTRITNTHTTNQTINVIMKT